MRRKRWWLIWLMWMAAGGMLACTLLGRGGKEIPTVVVTGEATSVLDIFATEEATPSGAGEPFTVVVTNASPYDICYLSLTPSEEEYWWKSKVSPQHPLSPGHSLTLNVEADTYDLLVENCRSATMGTAWGISRTTTIVIGGDGKVPLWAYNNSDAEICYFYSSPVDSHAWEDDLLGEQETIASGLMRVFFVEPGTYDLMVADCDDNEIASAYGLEVEGAMRWPLPEAPVPFAEEGEVTITVDNRSPYDVCYIFAVPSLAGTWGRDILGDDVIAPGESRTLTLPADRYDVLVEDCDGFTLATGWEIDDEATMNVGDPNTVPLVLINRSSQDLCDVYIAPAGSNDWGPNRLGQAEMIEAGDGRVFFLSPGKYDLSARSCDNRNVIEEHDISVESELLWKVSD